MEAHLTAGGALLARVERGAMGTRMSLLRPLTDPWKFYAVDGPGPFADEVKYATVLTLPEGSWAALKEGRAGAKAAGQRRYREWRERGGELPFDSSFAFIVIGPPADRFQVDLAADGTVARLVNQMTTRWRPGPFEQFVSSGWHDPENAGYWFWNEGSAQPPAWQPGTYRAFAAALKLLVLPLPEDGAVQWPNLPERVRAVLTPLARQLAERGFGADALPPLDLRRSGRNDEVVLTVSNSTDSDWEVWRELVSGPAGAVSDRIRIQLRGSDLDLRLEAGWKILSEDQE